MTRSKLSTKAVLLAGAIGLADSKGDQDEAGQVGQDVETRNDVFGEHFFYD